MELKIKKNFRDLIPKLRDDELKELEKSVLSEGIRDPICTWNGFIIDGHHRYELAGKHSLKFKVKKMKFSNEEEAKIWILTNQLSRRNITMFVRAELQLELEDLHRVNAKLINESISPKLFGLGHDLKELKTDTRKEIAKAAGVSHGYIFTVKQIKNKSPSEKTLSDLRNNKVTANKILKEMKREDAKAERVKTFNKTAKRYKPSRDIKIINADFYSWCATNLDDDSVDLILTDPPYPKEFLYLWDQLGEVAARVLKPDGYLATYSGQLYLDYVMNKLGEHLSYCWMIALQHKGATQIVHPRRVVCTWKPIIVYRKGTPGKFNIDVEAVVDSISDDYREKGFHKWGQGETAVAYLMRKLSKPGDLVLDPLVGGGTTLVVAQTMKRKCIGIEIDEKYMDVIKSNLDKPVQEVLF